MFGYLLAAAAGFLAGFRVRATYWVAPYTCPNCGRNIWPEDGAEFSWYYGQDYCRCPHCGISQKAKWLPPWAKLTDCVG